MHFLRTFGGLALERDKIAAPDWDKHRNGPAILTVLAAEGAVSRDRLMALLWPESDSTRARGSLKQAVHQLRQMLGDFDAIQGERTLDLNPAVIQSDVRQFREAVDRGDLARAVTLYQGPFLDGIHLADTPEFEQWVDERRRDLAPFAISRRRRPSDAITREPLRTWSAWATSSRWMRTSCSRRCRPGHQRVTGRLHCTRRRRTRTG
jgi:DNA-binding SARP family transcriptional activator